MEGFDQPQLFNEATNVHHRRNVRPRQAKGTSAGMSSLSRRKGTASGKNMGLYDFCPEPSHIRLSAVKNNPLAGITFFRLVRLLYLKEMERWSWSGRRGNGIDWHLYPHRIAALLALSVFNSLLAALEAAYVWLFLRKEMAIAADDDQAPVFVLGHPRTGTTLLHSLMALDSQRFCVCNTFHAGFPTAFLSFESFGKALFAPILTPTRPMDAMPLHFDLPQEDELATSLLTGGRYSPYMSLYFMKDEQSFRQYQSMRGVDPKEKEIWVQSFQHLLVKLKCRDMIVQNEQRGLQRGDSGRSKRRIAGFQGWLSNVLQRVPSFDRGGDNHPAKRRPRRLLLKSPCHTARAELLLNLFPNAKFVYIHRNPYEVFLSGAHMASTTYGYMFLQRPTDEMLQEYVLRQGEILVGEYGRCKRAGILNETNCVEVSFEDLTSQPYDSIRRIYQALKLSSSFPSDPSTAEVNLATGTRSYAPTLHQRCLSLAGYKRNTFENMRLDASLVGEIERRWHCHFEEYGYKKGWPPE